MTTISESNARMIRDELAKLQDHPNRTQDEEEVLTLVPLFLANTITPETINRLKELTKNRELCDPAWGLVLAIDALIS